MIKKTQMLGIDFIEFQQKNEIINLLTIFNHLH